MPNGPAPSCVTARMRSPSSGERSRRSQRRLLPRSTPTVPVIRRRQQHRAGNPAAVVRAYPAGWDRPDACCIVTRSSSMLRRTTLAAAGRLLDRTRGVRSRGHPARLVTRARGARALRRGDARDRHGRSVSPCSTAGLALAESAVGRRRRAMRPPTSPSSAIWAVACSSARSVSGTCFDVRRVRREIDRTLELAPLRRPESSPPRASCCSSCRVSSAATRPRASGCCVARSRSRRVRRCRRRWPSTAIARPAPRTRSRSPLTRRAARLPTTGA